MDNIESNNRELFSLIEDWEPKLLALPAKLLAERRNSQNRIIKQIVGHMIDSATNKIHRIVQLHNFATHGNNDSWIAIQNYQYEDWETRLIPLKECILDYLRHFKLHLDEIDKILAME